MRPKKSISYQELRDLIPEQYLDDLAIKTKVDHSVSKLTGQNMFSLLLYGFTSGRLVSLRILEQIFNSPIFQLQKMSKEKIHHQSIAERLKTMKPVYFKNIFDYLAGDQKIRNWMGVVGQKYVVSKIDSTIVNLSSKLLNIGLKINPGKRDLKFSLSLTEGLPLNLELLTGQSFASEDKALPKIMAKEKAKAKSQLTILIFDRGVQKKATFAWIDETLNLFFISRLSSQHYQVDRRHKQIKGRTAGDLILISDEVIHFANSKTKGKKEVKKQYRLITAFNPKNQQKYQFLTNIYFLNAVEISQLYKSRWEIEIFFKFIKQNLSFSHLLSRTRNGIKIQMYMTMITAILIAVYKKINKVEGWVIAKMRLMQELELNIIETFFEDILPMFPNSKKISLLFNDS